MAGGIEAIVRLINTQQPQAKVIVLVRPWERRENKLLGEPRVLCETGRDGRSGGGRSLICLLGSRAVAFRLLLKAPPKSTTENQQKMKSEQVCASCAGGSSGSFGCVSSWVWLDKA